jgi:hypothetical protein
MNGISENPAAEQEIEFLLYPDPPSSGPNYVTPT